MCLHNETPSSLSLFFFVSTCREELIYECKWKFVEKKNWSISAADKQLEPNQSTQIVLRPSLSTPTGGPLTPQNQLPHPNYNDGHDVPPNP